MNGKEKTEYRKLLSDLEHFAKLEKASVERLKLHLHMKHGKKMPVIQAYDERLEIAGLHVKHSVYYEKQFKGFMRDEKSIEDGLEARQESLEIRKQLEKEIADFRERYPDASLENDEAIQELANIVLKYEGKLKTRHDSMKRRINEFKNVVNANWESWTHFITLTFRENITDIDTAQGYFSDWTEKMADKFENFLFVAVKEFQQRGAVHYHCLVRVKKKMSKDEFKSVRNLWLDLDKEPERITDKDGNLVDNPNKVMGNPDIKSVMVKYVPQKFIDEEEWESKKQRHIWSLGNYLTSYLKKGATDPRLFGKKLFTSSAKKKLKEKIVITDKEKIHQTLRAINVDGLNKNSYKIKDKHIDENGNIVTGNDDIGEINYYNMLIKNDEKNNKK